ncbi:Ribosomal protein S18 acetylase RimI [Lachnospiraceae bacterium NE2001]|nr:Ribosomal protein S18 acetylase RimI [Lachnospiraceae bacterium NE2001]
MKIIKAEIEDLKEILELQYLAYQSEAALFGTDDIPPLKETLEEVIEEYNNGIVLKMVFDESEKDTELSNENGKIIGSVRAYEKDGTAYIGKLMVHPDFRGQGYGTKLLNEIQKYYSNKRYELFTSTRSVDNIRLYEKNGFKKFKQEAVTDELIFVYMEK